MDDIIAALIDFLRREEAFNDSVREQARQRFREIATWRIFHGMVPRSAQTFSLYLEELTLGTHQGIRTVGSILNAFVDFNIVTRDTDTIDGAYVGRKASLELVRMVAGYQGALNDSISAQAILHRNGPSLLTIPAKDKSGNWPYRFRTTFLVGVTLPMPAGVD